MPSALVVFTSHPNSHPFQERHVYLEEPVTIGRSVARSRSAPNNATFDCKVLSRNHALVWFDHKTDKFYLQDNRSSNGTFINNHRLSQAGQGSPPTQILSGDVIQFGVDVTESNHSVTHGCIVSSVWLFLPNGVETLKRSDVTPSPSPLPVDKFVANTPSVYSQELFQLSQYLQEALQREQMLEQKLATLQSLLASTQEASKNSWQALVDEDWLFSKLEVMGNMLQACSTNQTEEGVRELVALQKDKHNYESTTKEALRQILQEKVEVCQTLAKVERSLCSAQDTCLHLQHLKERAEDELTELANKYNTAVNLIKDLTNILKLAGQQQEGETQKLLKEKKELQLRINSVEEREQMLHANSDFTNQHLTSLQGCLEQLQDKITKNNIVENLLLTSGSDCRFIHQLIECQKVLNDHLHSNRTTQGISPYQPEKLKARLINSHLQNIMDEETQKGVNSGKVQMDAAEWVVSDTLGSCKDRTTKHCTVSQMDEQEQSAPVNKATPLTEEPGRGALPSSEAEQAVQLLTAQLREAQDQAVSSQRRYVELQDVFEQKRRETQLHTRESANQIQALQAQVQKLQGEVKVLRAERESVASSSQEEVQLLRRAMEASTNNWERESVSLQESLGSVTAELERWRRTAAECKEETVGLKARLQDLIQHSAQAAQLQGEVQKKCAGLQTECAALRAEKTALQENIQRLEKELHSSQDQGTLLGRNVSALERTQGELESRLAEQQDQHGQNSARLKAQLEQAAKRTKGLQREYEDTQVQLVQVKERCCEVEQEKLSLSQELQQCRSSLRQLQERASRFEETQVQLVQVEQEKLSLSELLQECRSSLRQLEERASCYEETQVQLVQVKERCCEVEQEKLSLSEELQECRSSLRQLQERASRPSLQPLLAVLVGMVLAVLFWGCSNLW